MGEEPKVLQKGGGLSPGLMSAVTFFLSYHFFLNKIWRIETNSQVLLSDTESGQSRMVTNWTSLSLTSSHAP